MPAIIVIALGLMLAPAAFAQSSPLLDILSEELNRNFSTLKQKADPAPYYLAYTVVEQQVHIVSGSLGTLQSRNQGHARTLDVSIRLGSNKLDNYHMVGGERPQFTTATPITIEDNANSIKRRLWLETDRTFRGASQRLINLKTSTQVNVAAEDTSDDFSKEEPSVYVEPVKKLGGSPDDWTDRVRKWSAELAKYSGVLASNVTVVMQRE